MGPTTNGPGELTCRVMSVLWLSDPLVAVTCTMNVPVDATGVVVNPIGELASPPARGVTDGGMSTATPTGALPTQEVEKVTGESNPPSELTITLVPPLSPEIVDTVSDDELTTKSGTTMVTGARTDGVPAIVVEI